MFKKVFSLLILIIIIFILFFLFRIKSSSNSDTNFIRQIPQKESLLELNYIDTLKKSNFKNIKLFIPLVGELGYGRNHYSIEADCNIKLTKSNLDSLIEIRKNLLKLLYSNVLEDSIILDCNEFNFWIKFRMFDFDPFLNDELTDPIRKDSLQKWCGFKVIKVGEKVYKRVKI